MSYYTCVWDMVHGITSVNSSKAMCSRDGTIDCQYYRHWVYCASGCRSIQALTPTTASLLRLGINLCMPPPLPPCWDVWERAILICVLLHTYYATLRIISARLQLYI